MNTRRLNITVLIMFTVTYNTSMFCVHHVFEKKKCEFELIF